jgi:hypothetical protein
VPQISATNKVNRTSSDSLVCTTLGSLKDISSESSVQNLKNEASESSASTSTSTNGAAGTGSMESNSPFYQLRKEATILVANTLERGRRNLWQLTTSRLSVLLSCAAVCSTSTYQFLRNYEDICIFILAGEVFCGVEATEFRAKLKAVCENYIVNFHRQNVYVRSLPFSSHFFFKFSTVFYKFVSGFEVWVSKGCNRLLVVLSVVIVLFVIFVLICTKMLLIKLIVKERHKT